MRRTHALALTAALSLALTACSSGNDAADDAPPVDAPAADSEAAGNDTAGNDDATATTGGSVTYTATDSITWATPDQEASAGTIDMTLVCSPSVEHELAIEGVDGDAALLSCAPGEQATGEVELTAGEYTVFCSIPGHREAGMEGTLRVS